MTREEAEKILITAFGKKEFLPSHYLANKYSELQLNRLMVVAKLSTHNIGHVISLGKEEQFGMTKFVAFSFKAFLESQFNLIVDAINELNKVDEPTNKVKCSLIGGGQLKFEMSEN